LWDLPNPRMLQERCWSWRCSGGTLWDLPDTVACPGLELEVRRAGKAGYYCCMVAAVVAKGGLLLLCCWRAARLAVLLVAGPPSVWLVVRCCCGCCRVGLEWDPRQFNV
jgi:hypothetical protein